jgi:hypothetical protein
MKTVVQSTQWIMISDVACLFGLIQRESLVSSAVAKEHHIDLKSAWFRS